MIEVRESTVEGLGLFATEAIPNESYIDFFQGSIVLEDDTHVLWITTETGDEFGIDVTNDLRYLNHSSDANCAVYGVYLYAERDIEAGEELFIDYGWDDDNG